MPRTLCNNIWVFEFFLLVERRLTQFVNVPPYEILVFPTNFFFLAETKFHGVKSVLPFSKLIIGKSQVFSARSYVYLHGYTQIRDSGGTMPPPGPNRVNKGLLPYCSHLFLRLSLSICPNPATSGHKLRRNN